MHTAPIPQTGLQGLLPRGAPSLWLSLLAFFFMLSPFRGPALDHHFAERLPNHLHIFAGGLPHDHDHGHAHTHGHEGATTEQFLPRASDGAGVSYLAQFDGLPAAGAFALLAPANTSDAGVGPEGVAFWDFAAPPLLAPNDIYFAPPPRPPSLQ